MNLWVVASYQNMRLRFTFLATLILAPAMHAAPLAGAWEAFPTQANADAWFLFTYDSGVVTSPTWAGTNIDPNPYVYSGFTGGDGVWFFATDQVAQGVFAGDYGAEKISGVDVSVLINPSEIDYIDLVVYADGPEGLDFYYSLVYLEEDFDAATDWYNLSFSFSESWFSLDGGNFTEFQPDEVFLASIEEVGLRVFPVIGTSATSSVGVDDFILVPTVEGPELATDVSGNDFVMEFTPNPGVEATIEKLLPDFEWEVVAGETELTGPQIFTTPVDQGTELFRVGVAEKLTQVTSP